MLGEGLTSAPVGFHHDPSARFLLIADSDHVDSAFHAEHCSAHGEGRAPLSRPALSYDPLNPLLLVVVGLGDGCVGLVAPRGAHIFRLEENLGGSLEEPFQASGPY